MLARPDRLTNVLRTVVLDHHRGRVVHHHHHRGGTAGGRQLPHDIGGLGQAGASAAGRLAHRHPQYPGLAEGGDCLAGKGGGGVHLVGPRPDDVVDDARHRVLIAAHGHPFCAEVASEKIDGRSGAYRSGGAQARTADVARPGDR